MTYPLIERKMNTTKTNQQLIQFNAKKDLYELKIEVNDLGTLEMFLRNYQFFLHFQFSSISSILLTL